jgi:polyphenol oxidase
VLAWREELPGGVRLAVTDRRDGSSTGPYATLNLAAHVGDDAGAVTDNRERLLSDLGLPSGRFVVADQVHGAEVAEVRGPWDGPPPRADALVTAAPGLLLAVLVADCVPVLLAAPEAGVVGVAHAGRQGMAAGVVQALVRAVRDLGGRDVLARVGPAVCGRCYEVPAPMRDEVAEAWPVARSVTRRGTPALDVGAAVVEQLVAVGVRVAWLDGCTVERADLYSYRRDATTGRFAGLAWRVE